MFIVGVIHGYNAVRYDSDSFYMPIYQIDLKDGHIIKQYESEMAACKEHNLARNTPLLYRWWDELPNKRIKTHIIINVRVRLLSCPLHRRR